MSRLAHHMGVGLRVASIGKADGFDSCSRKDGTEC